MPTNDHEPLQGINLCNIYRCDHLIKSAKWAPISNTLAYTSDEGIIYIQDLTTGESKQLKLKMYGEVLSFAWAPDERTLAISFSDKSVRLFNVVTSSSVRTFQSHTNFANHVAWSPTGDKVAWTTGQTVEIRTLSIKHSHSLTEHNALINSCEWSPDGNVLASCSDDQTVRLWREHGKQGVLVSHFGPVLSVTWSPTGRTLVSSSSDATIRFWNPRSNKELGHLEGHTHDVLRTTFSPDGRILVSSSRDGSVRLWRSDSWEAIAILNSLTEGSAFVNTVAFHPTKPLLLTVTSGEEGKIIKAWEVNIDRILSIKHTTPSVRYTNAKVVLVGDTGVGKSGLGLTLSRRPFVPTESTHSRHVWTLERVEVDIGGGRTETRETLLWDLAGQPGYRLIHQLYLREVSVALVIFDARSETNPFSGVHHWHRALEQAQRYTQSSGVPLTKFLVAARVDRGGISVSRMRVTDVLNELGFQEYFSTSAKQSWGIQELQEAIRQAIKWDELPRITSTLLFQQIKAFLIEEKIAGRLMSTAEDLFLAFLKANTDLENTREMRAQFETCIDLVESRDLIKRLSFGGIVLLQPELLDAYASSIIEAAREEPDGLGCISELDVTSGQFPVPVEERIQNEEKEKLLLFATIEDLLRHEIALRDQGEEGPILIFPSQITRTYPDLTNPIGKEIIFHFEGPVLNVYATLAVRLARSGLYSIAEMWKNAITYKTMVGGTCGILLNDLDEGRGQLVVFFSKEVTEESRQQFEHYVHKHLQRRTLNVRRQRVFICPQCLTEVTELQVKRRLEVLEKRSLEKQRRDKQEKQQIDKQASGENDETARRKRREKKIRKTLNCNVCDSTISLRDQYLADPSLYSIPQMDRAADIQREREAAASVLQGKIATGDYDVFMCHCSNDKPNVKEIGERLKGRGILPWLDEWELQPGLPWQRILSSQIENIRTAAVFIGVNGVGPWQTLELESFLRQFVKRGLPVIPVILPNCRQTPTLPLFLDGMTWVDFRESDPDPLDRLIWGITGQRKVLDEAM